MRTFTSILSLTIFVLSLVAGFFIAAVLFLVTFPFDPHRRVVGRFFRWMGVFIARLSLHWTFAVRKPLPSYRPGRTVIVSNHASNSDIFLVSHLPWEMKWLAKASVFRAPFLGWLLWLAGDIPVKRGERDSAKSAMARARRYLEHGMPIMIFPEGTRSTTMELLPFKEGAFRLALDAGADVLPIAIAGTRTAMEVHSWRVGFARGLVGVGTPIKTGEHGITDVTELSNAARAQIIALAAELEAELKAESMAESKADSKADD
ncbi:MAG: 1-acyl-sn-glycerol-3-phosphate acyltransferase [Myxococcales bacterium]|nr:1-acyl-sn-glycerol-3-phosphate acyltransferase [Myxococcales bacterium]